MAKEVMETKTPKEMMPPPIAPQESPRTPSKISEKSLEFSNGKASVTSNGIVGSNPTNIVPPWGKNRALSDNNKIQNLQPQGQNGQVPVPSAVVVRNPATNSVTETFKSTVDSSNIDGGSGGEPPEDDAKKTGTSAQWHGGK